MVEHRLEDKVKNAFDSGYSNAASSLSKMTNHKINFDTCYQGVESMRAKPFMDQTTFHDNAGDVLVTTEVFGDVVGKSYLYFTHREYNLLTAAIPDSTSPEVNLKEEFMKEVDNILSAAVITRLSNELNLRMFGDVPVLAAGAKSRIQDTIYRDFRYLAEEVYVSASFLKFETCPGMRLSFVWVMHNKIVQMKARPD